MTKIGGSYFRPNKLRALQGGTKNDKKIKEVDDRRVTQKTSSQTSRKLLKGQQDIAAAQYKKDQYTTKLDLNQLRIDEQNKEIQQIQNNIDQHENKIKASQNNILQLQTKSELLDNQFNSKFLHIKAKIVSAKEILDNTHLQMKEIQSHIDLTNLHIRNKTSELELENKMLSVLETNYNQAQKAHFKAADNQRLTYDDVLKHQTLLHAAQKELLDATNHYVQKDVLFDNTVPEEIKQRAEAVDQLTKALNTNGKKYSVASDEYRKTTTELQSVQQSLEIQKLKTQNVRFELMQLKHDLAISQKTHAAKTSELKVLINNLNDQENEQSALKQQLINEKDSINQQVANLQNQIIGDNHILTGAQRRLVESTGKLKAAKTYHKGVVFDYQRDISMNKMRKDLRALKDALNFYKRRTTLHRVFVKK